MYKNDPLPGLSGSHLLTQGDLSRKRPYAGIPTPIKDIDSMYATIVALVEIIEVLTRSRGNIDHSVLTLGETEKIIEGLRFDIAELHRIKQDKP